MQLAGSGRLPILNCSGWLHISIIAIRIIYYLWFVPIQFLLDVLRSDGDATYASLLLW